MGNPSQVEKKPLEHLTARRLSHTRACPGEWIGKLDDGATIYVVSTGRHLRVVVAADLNAALRLAKNDKVQIIKLTGYPGRFTTTDQMLETTGLRLNCAPKEKVLDAKP